jgi:hypothetical protein
MEGGFACCRENGVHGPKSVWMQKTEVITVPGLFRNAQLEITKLTRKQYGQINYYTRILPTLASMTSLVHGVPEPLVKLHNRLLAAV